MANAGIIQKQQAAAAVKAKNPTIQDMIRRMGGEIEKALPSVITPERFTRITLSALSTNPQLQQCTPKSFLGAMMTSAQLGMEVNTPLGQAYLIPRRNNKTGEWECQFQLGYKGLIDMAHRSSEIRDIQAHVVCKGDEFEYELGLEPKLIHKPAAANRGEPTHFYAVYHTKNGGYGFEVMSVEDVRKHAMKYSDSMKRGSFSPWQTAFEEMAKKTVLKRVLKYAPMSTEYVRAALQDETIKTKLSDDMFDVPDETIEAEFMDVDPETGEIKEAKENAAE
jgi:recombination protein RecT